MVSHKRLKVICLWTQSTASLSRNKMWSGPILGQTLVKNSKLNLIRSNGNRPNWLPPTLVGIGNGSHKATKSSDAVCNEHYNMHHMWIMIWWRLAHARSRACVVYLSLKYLLRKLIIRLTGLLPSLGRHRSKPETYAMKAVIYFFNELQWLLSWSLIKLYKHLLLFN